MHYEQISISNELQQPVNNLPKPVLHRICTIKNELSQIENVSMPRQIHPVPPWEELKFIIDDHILNETYGKDNTPNIVYKSLFRELSHNYINYPPHIYRWINDRWEKRLCHHL